MGLFNRLLKLQTVSSTEDFFTEIVAHLLRNTDELLPAWLEHLGLAEADEVADYEVTTQVSYDEGRPDILIELYAEDTEDWVFIESKLGSQEGSQQLLRYARTLAAQSHVRHRWLLYITRDYDPKDASAILKGVPRGSVNFRQLRWCDFYRFLEERRDDTLIDAACTFMEERGMSQTNQISPTEILAMARLPQVLSLMNETLFGEVRGRLEELVGSVSTVRRTRQELGLNRYIIGGDLFPDLWCSVGYWFEEADYPSLGMMLVMRPKAIEHADGILEFFRALSATDDWIGVRLNKPKSHPNVKRRRPLNELLAGGDHLSAIKDHFIELIDDLEELIRKHPRLPWDSTWVPSADDEEE